MQRLLSWIILGVSTLSLGKTVEMGLDVLAPSVRAKTPVIVYIGNDVMAPLLGSPLDQNVLCLRALFKGEQCYRAVGTETHAVYSDRVLEYHKGLPDADKTFLAALSDFILREVSDDATAYASQVLRDKICRKNPQYRSGLVVVRNFQQPSPLSPERNQITWGYCGADPKDSSLRESRFTLPANEPALHAYPFTGQPLTSAGVVQQLFEQVLETFNPKAFRFLVVVHSQGYRSLIFTPRFPGYLVDVDGIEVMARVLAAKESLTDSHGTIPYHRGAVAQLIRVWDTLLPDGHAAAAHSGISAESFFTMLSNLQADIPLVALDVNGVHLADTFSQNVGTVYFSEQPLAHDALSIDSVFRYLGVTQTDLEDRLRSVLPLTDLGLD